MKITKVFAAGAVVAAVAFFPLVSKAQSNTGSQPAQSTATGTVKQDQHALNQQEDKMAADKAQRNKDEKNGHPNQAVKDEKQVQQDQKAVKDDKKQEAKDKAADKK